MSGVQVLARTEKWITLSVPAELDCGEEAMKILSGFVREENFISAVREVLWNAIEHGGKLNPNLIIRIDLLHSSRALSCFVKDPGKGFLISELRHAAINNPEEDAVKHVMVREQEGMRPGGYGILLAKNFVDELIYNEHGNEVLLVKYLS